MFRRLAVMVTLVLALTVALPAAAQDGDYVDPEEMEGITGGFMRVYAQPALMAPDTSRVNIGRMAAEVPLMTVAGLFLFEDADIATGYLDDLAAGVMADILSTDEYDEVTLDDVGDEATMYTGETEYTAGATDQAGKPVMLEVTVIVARENANAFVVATVGGDSEATSRDMMAFMLDGKIGDPETLDFSEDGTSTGGAFDVMPTVDDEDLLQGMKPVMDSQLETEDAAS